MTQNNAPLISVITVVRNGEKFIGECLQNVVDQRCDKIEHIIIDGASTDKTVEIIKKYSVQYPHIRYISEPDKGQSDAMNKGLVMAQGEIVGFLNYDDSYESGVLNRIMEIIPGMQEPSLIFGNCKILDDEENILFINRPADFSLRSIIERKTFPSNPSAYFYHRSLHDLIGPFPIDEHFVMDVYFLLRAATMAKLKYFNENWGIFRMHITSKTYLQDIVGETEKSCNRVIENFIKGMPFGKRWYFRLIIKVRKIRDYLQVRKRMGF